MTFCVPLFIGSEKPQKLFFPIFLWRMILRALFYRWVTIWKYFLIYYIFFKFTSLFYLMLKEKVFKCSPKFGNFHLVTLSTYVFIAIAKFKICTFCNFSLAQVLGFGFPMKCHVLLHWTALVMFPLYEDEAKYVRRRKKELNANMWSKHGIFWCYRQPAIFCWIFFKMFFIHLI